MAAKPAGPPSPNAIPFGDPSEFSRETHREAAHAASRRFLKAYVAPGGIGAEIGVFWAHFAEVILQEFAPAKLYLVDPWHKLHGETYPNWGRYTNFGALETRETLRAARFLEKLYPGIVEVKVKTGRDFLRAVPDGYFDWVYLDARHKYEAVRDDLIAILPKLKPQGMILGDDYFLDPQSQHAGVKRAADEFAETHGFDLVFEARNQYVLRRP
jgi:predicted O-methyltransferase YrrM